MEKFIGIILITLLITEYAYPIEVLKKVFNISNDSEPKKEWGRFWQKFFNCAQCTGFWAGLIVYQDVYMAAIISFASEATQRIVEKIYMSDFSIKK